MQKSDLDNANPTILSESQLPSRGRKRDVVRNGPESKYNDILFSEQPWLWDLSNSTTAWSSDESSDSDGGELADEPIDEQEIYGKRTHTRHRTLFFFDFFFDSFSLGVLTTAAKHHMQRTKSTKHNRSLSSVTRDETTAWTLSCLCVWQTHGRPGFTVFESPSHYRHPP